MPAYFNRVTRIELVPGAVVSVPFIGVFRHRGIVSDRFANGKPMVISNSPSAGGLTEEPWDTFAAGNEVTIEGYPSDLPSYIVIQRARARVGSSYQLFNWNCEHLVSYAHGQQPESPQVAAVVVLAILLGLLRIASKA